jgi:hypothetical protein
MEMSTLIPTVASVALLACATAGPASAGDYDGSRPLICAAMQAFSCQANGQCVQGTADGLNIPQFFWIDAAAKTIGEKGLDGQIRTSSIQTVTQSPTHLIVQGTIDHLGWSATIAKGSGKMTMMEVDGASAQAIFGACTPTK